MNFLVSVLLAVHLLSGAAWFGALVYRLFFVEPKSQSFFKNWLEYESFSLNLAHGMRYIVMVSLICCGVSGFILLGLRWENSSAWWTIQLVKVGLWMLAFAIFIYISWVYWPKRVFIDESTRKRLGKQGFALAFVMIVLSGSGLLLGQLSRFAE